VSREEVERLAGRLYAIRWSLTDDKIEDAWRAVPEWNKTPYRHAANLFLREYIPKEEITRRAEIWAKCLHHGWITTSLFAQLCGVSLLEARTLIRKYPKPDCVPREEYDELLKSFRELREYAGQLEELIDENDLKELRRAIP
jgi:hypothetical protein